METYLIFIREDAVFNAEEMALDQAAIKHRKKAAHYWAIMVEGY